MPQLVEYKLIFDSRLQKEKQNESKNCIGLISKGHKYNMPIINE